MLRYRGGELVQAGTYLSLGTGEFVGVPKQGARLPGEARVQYLRAPLPGVMALGPVMGLVFILFVPFAAVAAIIAFTMARIGKGLRASSQSLVQIAAPAWKPGVSFFSRQRRQARKGQGQVTPGKTEDVISALEKELQEKKHKGE